jgi:hypothetical protein
MLRKFNLKLSAATLVCLAIIFRLLFINVGLISSLSSSSSKLFAKHSSVLKKRRRIEVSAAANLKDYSALEICAEDPDNEEEMEKSTAPPLFISLFSFVKHLVFLPKSNFSFDTIKCGLFPKKYLALSVIRV